MNRISVIVPIYNSEKYIKKCLDSIINQTFKEFDIVLVNDGSTDNSLSIIENYKKSIEYLHFYSVLYSILYSILCQVFINFFKISHLIKLRKIF